jgi:hypothetical protein
MSQEREMPVSMAGKKRTYTTRSIIDPSWGISPLTRKVAP